jgi:hypothetical protein
MGIRGVWPWLDEVDKAMEGYVRRYERDLATALQTTRDLVLKEDAHLEGRPLGERDPFGAK